MTLAVLKPRAAMRAAGALAVIAALASGPASAKTEAECKQQYSAQKAAGSTAKQTEAQYVKACLAADPAPPAGAEASQGGADINKLREEAQNPIAKLISVQFQDNLGFGYGPYNAPQNILDFQPVIPIHLNEDWNLITRWVSPIVYQPRLAPHLPSEFGIGNLEPQFFLSPENPGKLIWGVGPEVYLPTATNKRLGVNAWGVGPGVVGLTIQEPWVIGAHLNNAWAWRHGQQVNEMTDQYFINYNLPEGWYLTSQPIITADWQAPAHDKWVVPFGGGVGRLFRVGKLPPINAQVQVFYNAVRPTVGPLTGPTWSLRFQLSFLFPS